MATRSAVSFGTVKDTSSLDAEKVTVMNIGTETASLCWVLSDHNDAYRVSQSVQAAADGGTSLPANKTIKYTITPAAGLGAGNYDATLYIWDTLDLTGTRIALPVSMTVMSEKVTPVVERVSISPTKTTISPGSQVQFSGRAEGTGNPDTTVSWSIEGQKSKGTAITGDGLLSVSGDEKASNIIVTAASVQDRDKTAVAIVSLIQGSYTVTVKASPREGGKAAGTGAYEQGTRANLVAVANPGYRFTGWVKNGGDVVSKSSSYTTEPIGADTNYTAQFKHESCVVKVVSNDSDGGKVSGGGKVSYGGNTTIKAEPASGYEFKGWSENDTIISTNREECKVRQEDKGDLQKVRILHIPFQGTL